jgi:rSAM/selenodomain-associated transferase 1
MTCGAVCILARAPSAPGKTRLTAALSEDRALALRCALFLDTLESALASGLAVVVCYTPSTAREEFTAFVRPYQLIPQSAGDLGERMRMAFEDVFALGFDRVLLIGSDLPTLPPDHLTEALAALDRVPVVIGPADDGGYYLIGLRGPHPELFDGVSWGSPNVLTETLAIGKRTGVRIRLCRAWHDVDALADLAHVAASPRAHHTRAWLSQP